MDPDVGIATAREKYGEKTISSTSIDVQCTGSPSPLGMDHHDLLSWKQVDVHIQSLHVARPTYLTFCRCTWCVQVITLPNAFMRRIVEIIPLGSESRIVGPKKRPYRKCHHFY